MLDGLKIVSVLVVSALVVGKNDLYSLILE